MRHDLHTIIQAAVRLDVNTIVVGVPDFQNGLGIIIIPTAQINLQFYAEIAVALAVEKGLWQPSGAKTPEQTLYSAIFRENATKENPRIVKSDKKGKFIYAGE